MKMEEKGKKKNAPMKRDEVIFSVSHEGKATPSRQELLKQAASKLNVKDELVIVDRIFSSKGRSESEVSLLVYKKKDDIPRGKLEKMNRRMGKGKKKQAEEPKPEGKKEEKQEEKKEAEGKEKELADTEDKEEAEKQEKAEDKKEE